jgi:hypothetical protein
MDRGFFLADNDWTCYRRNYFQVSGAFSIHGLNNNPYYHPDQQQCLVQVDGQFLPVSNFSMNISARVSNSDKKIELVQHTPKRDKGPQTTPTGKLIIPGGNLNMSSVSGANQSIVTFERIQFKTATANNGKRRAAQQYYVCLVDLYAEIEDTKQKIKIASCQSAPLVVRGRSPGHYSDNNTNHERYENNLAAPQQQPQDERFNPSTFSRPPLASPGGPPPPVMGPDYASPYYQQYSNYSHFNPMQTPPPPPPTGMMMGSAPPTPTANQHPSLPPPQTQNNYMVPSMTTSDPSSSSSSPDLYNNNEERSNIQMHVENSTEWNRSRMNSVGSNQSPATPYEQQQHSYFNNYAYDHRKYHATNGAIIQQQAS